MSVRNVLFSIMIVGAVIVAQASGDYVLTQGSFDGSLSYDENGTNTSSGSANLEDKVEGSRIRIVFDYNDSDGFLDQGPTEVGFTNFQLFVNGSGSPIPMAIESVLPGPPGQYLAPGGDPNDPNDIFDAYEWEQTTAAINLIRLASHSEFDMDVSPSSFVIVRLLAPQSLEGLSIDRLEFDGDWIMNTSNANDFIGISGIPEPSMFAFLAGVGLFAFGRRRITRDADAS